MEALRTPLDAIRRRVNREIALRRAIPSSEVDAEAVRRFWSSLSPAVRLDVLRFTDSAIVSRVHGYMITLLKADIWSRMNEVSSASEVAPRLSGFEFEAPAERDCLGSLRAPIAILATEEFVVDGDLLETLELELGSPLLEGRPVLLKKDWSTVFDNPPSCWEDLQQQVYRLVELAIFHAERDPYFQLLSESSAAQASVPSRRGGRRKANKVIGRTPATKNDASKASQDMESNPSGPSVDAVSEAPERPESPPPPSEAKDPQRNEETTGENVGNDDAPLEVEEFESMEEKAIVAERIENVETLPEPAAKEETEKVGAEPVETRPISRSALLERPRLPRRLPTNEAVTCFQWLPDLFQDQPNHQFQLMQYRQKAQGIREAETAVARAVVKNTFFEVQVLDGHEAQEEHPLRRCASAGATLN
mmetsp:Transcript_23462/g.44190  ORF Transcript_23462/g.44190 Transcript_23462/m.44190 type:complete len:420 (+) Transcript_23462:81-1340(+)